MSKHLNQWTDAELDQFFASFEQESIERDLDNMAPAWREWGLRDLAEMRVERDHLLACEAACVD